MMNVVYSGLLLAIILTLSACKTTVETITTDQDIISNEEMGYLLVGVETNRSLRAINLGGESGIRLSHEDLRQGSNFILVELAAGEYVVEKVELNRWLRLFLEDEENWAFTVKPQTISYVGHLEIIGGGFFSRSSSIEFVNRSTEAVEFMEDSFPSILLNRDLYYGGPGNDSFFDVLNGKGE